MRETRLAKLTRPRIDGLVRRERLLRQLDDIAVRPIIWLSAPPGAGKTSLLATYISVRKRPSLWYQIDSADSDPGAFFHYLRTAAQELKADKRSALPILTTERATNLRSFSRLYFRQLFSRMTEGSVLALDNYHELPEGSEMHTALAAGLEETPAGVNVVISSRTGPHPAFAALRVAQRVGEITWPQLKLTLEEAVAISGRDQNLSGPIIGDLHRQTNGWAAGLVLMLERLKQTGQINKLIGSENLEILFDYFAGLLLGAASASARETLLRMSYMPRLTAELASAISGSPAAPKLLVEFSRRNLFIDRHFGQEPSYQFHALFRAFLQSQARHTLGAEEHHRIIHSAAALLETTNQVEDAFPMYLETAAWDAAARLLRNHAGQLLRDGRRRTLLEWISALPLQQVERDPWLSYWLAVTLLPENRPAALQKFESAFGHFAENADVEGMLTCASMAADGHFSSGWVGVRVWIDRLQTCLRELEEEVSAGVVTTALQSLARAMCFHALGDASLPDVIARVAAALDNSRDPVEEVRAVGILMLYHWLHGNVERCEQLYERLPSNWIALDTPVSDRLFCAYFSSCHLFASGSRARAEELLKNVSELTDEFNLAPLGVEFRYVSALPLMQDGHYSTARDLLDRTVRPFLATARPMATAWYHGLIAICELGLGRMDSAQTSFRFAIEQCSERENAASKSMMEPCYAFLLLEAGEFDEGMNVVRNLCSRLPNNPRTQFVRILAEAHLAFKTNDEENHTRALRQLAPRLLGFGHYGLAWAPIVLPRHLAAALARGIEPEIVNTYIERFQIRSPDPDLETWPWPVRLQALGTFRVVVARKDKNSGAKAQHRLLELLRLLVILGPNGGSLQVIIDTIWPDSEGDNGQRTLQVSLHRLRKLLGRDDTIDVREGRVRLNDSVCWIDAWVFERRATDILGMDSSDPRFVPRGSAVLRVYEDHLLSQEDRPGVLLTQRARLRRLWLSLVKGVAERHEQNGDTGIAEVLYRNAIDRDPSEEELYRRLMICLDLRGERADAVRTYQSCRAHLSTALGISPSPETEQVYARISTLRPV